MAGSGALCGVLVGSLGFFCILVRSGGLWKLGSSWFCVFWWALVVSGGFLVSFGVFWWILLSSSMFG